MNYEKLICGKNLIIKDVMKCIEDNAKGTASWNEQRKKILP